jgi:hypothetical protein
MLIREGPPGAGFQIPFKSIGDFLLRQRHISLDFPGLELIGVNRSSGIVLRESCAKIVRATNISLRRMIHATKDVNVEHQTLRFREAIYGSES